MLYCAQKETKNKTDKKIIRKIKEEKTMKKSVAVLMIFAIVLSLSASAFAATAGPYETADGYVDDYGNYVPPYNPTPNNPQGGTPFIPAVSNVGLLICLMEDDTIHQFVPMPLVTNVEYRDKDKLAKGDAEALKEAHDAAKQIEGKSLKQSYFFSVPDNYDVDEEHYAKYIFSCPGNNVEVCVNGHPVEVVSINGRTSYIAKVTERGCITITVDK